jgi:hypothetical protein
MNNEVRHLGRVAQLGEHLICIQGVAGSTPVASTILKPKSAGKAEKIISKNIFVKIRMRNVAGRSFA